MPARGRNGETLALGGETLTLGDEALTLGGGPAEMPVGQSERSTPASGSADATWAFDGRSRCHRPTIELEAVFAGTRSRSWRLAGIALALALSLAAWTLGYALIPR